MTQLFNKVSELEKRRSLRNNMPKAEVMLWGKLRLRQVEGCRFRRQYSVGAFVIDFYCPELKLAIEVDGASHLQEGIPEYDAQRQGFLESKGIFVLRVTNDEVYGDLNVVVGSITEAVLRLRSFLKSEAGVFFPPLQGEIEGGSARCDRET
jgi:very-short-patch-repair endonuclease